jgi:leucyl/phenylalanyl-tRNA---protein transferase
LPIYRLSEALIFPSPEEADADGLLAVGGDLRPERLILAYHLGIFPWYAENSPILWWSPDPRLILDPKKFRVPRSLNRVLNKGIFMITVDHSFESVIRGCAQARRQGEKGTWIGDDMIKAYVGLHKAGFAHSVESWCDGILAGGLYGVSLGRVFFGESMFYRRKDASKVALVYLIRLLQYWEYEIIDCQVTTANLLRFGAQEIPRFQFLRCLSGALRHSTRRGIWSFPDDLLSPLTRHEHS